MVLFFTQNGAGAFPPPYFKIFYEEKKKRNHRKISANLHKKLYSVSSKSVNAPWKDWRQHLSPRPIISSCQLFKRSALFQAAIPDAKFYGTKGGILVRSCRRRKFNRRTIGLIKKFRWGRCRFPSHSLPKTSFIQHNTAIHLLRPFCF